jgi:hypothetical protein
MSEILIDGKLSFNDRRESRRQWCNPFPWPRDLLTKPRPPCFINQLARASFDSQIHVLSQKRCNDDALLSVIYAPGRFVPSPMFVAETLREFARYEIILVHWCVGAAMAGLIYGSSC